jgi:hypothetical protein
MYEMEKYTRAGEAIVSQLKSTNYKIQVFLFTFSLMWFLVGSLMFSIEGPENGFTNLPVSCYWAIVTLTTVGYGDISPSTTFGRLVASLVMMIGYGIIAVPATFSAIEMAAVKRQTAMTRHQLNNMREEYNPHTTDVTINNEKHSFESEFTIGSPEKVVDSSSKEGGWTQYGNGEEAGGEKQSLMMKDDSSVGIAMTGLLTKDTKPLVCPRCTSSSHESDALFCKYCGESLRPAFRRHSKGRVSEVSSASISRNASPDFKPSQSASLALLVSDRLTLGGGGGGYDMRGVVSGSGPNTPLPVDLSAPTSGVNSPLISNRH